MGSAQTVRTVCPRDCYGACGMLVTVEDGRITSIEGDPKNPATAGHVCLKGLSYARSVADPNRLLTPLRRRRDRSGFDPVGWDEALSEIAGKLDHLRRALGPESVLFYEANGSQGCLGQLAMAFWHQFGGCTLTYGSLCAAPGIEATRLTYGANRHSHPRLTAASRFILLWGHNPAETSVHQMRLILEAQERGATVALVDPRSTDTSDAADLHVKPRPGTDAALALGIAAVIVDASLHDAAFLEGHAAGFEAFRARLSDYPPDRVASITGVPEAQIQELALEYARAKPALLIAGFGLQRHRHAGQAIRAVALLPALTGNVGVPGGGWQYANLVSNCLRPPPLPPEAAPLRRTIPISRLGWGIEELHDPRVAAIWVERGNPVSQNPHSSLLLRALEKLELVVVVDHVMTDTAAVADYVLPATTLFEEEDLVTAYWHPYLQLQARVLDPPEGVKTGIEIWRLLSERLGLDTRYFPDDTRAVLRRMLPEDGADLLDALAEGPVDPSGLGDVAFEDRHFPTPSGKVEFASAEAARLWGVDAVPDYRPLEEGHESRLSRRFPLQLLSCKTRERIHSQFGNLDWLGGAERFHKLDIHPADAAARGLAQGDRAAVWNDRGRIELEIRLDHGLLPGVVHVLEGRCHEGDPEVNVLTGDGVTDMAHGATFYECLVEVGRA